VNSCTSSRKLSLSPLDELELDVKGLLIEFEDLFELQESEQPVPAKAAATAKR